MSYPSNYYLPVSFGRQLTHSEIIDKIGIENFPSPKIAEMFEAQPDKTLYEVHKKYYAPLLKCETLEEAKEKYPEFEEVIDAKDVNIDKLGNRNTLRKIAAGKIEGASLDNLSLELLKSRYAHAKGAQNKEFYFNLANVAVYGLFKTLKIKEMNEKYLDCMIHSSPRSDEYREKKRSETQARWDADDGTMRRKNRECMIDRWASDDGTMLEQAKKNVLLTQSEESRRKHRESVKSDKFRKSHRNIMIDRWASDDGTMLEKSKNTASTVLQSEEVKAKRLDVFHTDEFRAKRSGIMLDLWADEEYRNTQSSSRKAFYQTERGEQYIEAKKLAHKRHPEITAVRKCLIQNLAGFF